MRLIDKDTVVAELEKLYNLEYDYTSNLSCGKKIMLRHILLFLDSLEVREVELEKELDKEWNKCEPIDEGMGLEVASIEHEQFDNIAKHFFELGLAQKSK